MYTTFLITGATGANEAKQRFCDFLKCHVTQ